MSSKIRKQLLGYLSFLSILMLMTMQAAFSSPSGKFEPRMCKFNQSPFVRCKVMYSYINRGSGFLVEIVGPDNKLYELRSTKDNKYVDAKGRIWIESVFSDGSANSFRNSITGETILIK
jgi:hypothetical protein